MNNRSGHGFITRAFAGMLLAPDPITPWWVQTVVSYASHTYDRELLLTLLAARPELDPHTLESALTYGGGLANTKGVSERLEAATRRDSVDGIEQMTSGQRLLEAQLLGGWSQTSPPCARLIAIARAELSQMSRGESLRRYLVQTAGPTWTLGNVSDEVLKEHWNVLTLDVDQENFVAFCDRARSLRVPMYSNFIPRCPSTYELARNADLFSSAPNKTRIQVAAEAAAEVARRGRSTEIVDHVLQTQDASDYVTVVLLNDAAGHVDIGDLPELLSVLKYMVLSMWSPRPRADLGRDGGRWFDEIDERTRPLYHRHELLRVLVDLHDRDALVANEVALTGRLEHTLATMDDPTVSINKSDVLRITSSLRTALPLHFDVAAGNDLSSSQVEQVVAFVGEDALRLQVLADVVDGAKHITLGDALATAETLLH